MTSNIKYYAMLSLAILSVSLGQTSFSATELARINGKVISLEEFQQKYKDNLKFFPLNPPSKINVLEDLIKRELGIQEALKQGLDKDPQVVDRMNTVLFHALLEKKLDKEFEAIHVTNSEAQSYYKKFPTIRTSHIFVGVPPGASAAEQKQAHDKIAKIHDEYLVKGKKSFAEVAQQYSEGPAAPMGGDLDYQNRDRLDPIFYDTAVKLGSPGKVSGIIRTQFGYHIIKLTGIRKWQEADQVEIKRLVLEDEKAKLFDRYMSQLKSKSKVTIHANLLEDK